MSVAHVGDEDTGAGNVCCAEKLFANGDYYTGQWLDNLPHGHGKYLWSDGCIYVGDWFKGKTNGKGRFSWSSGATYEGRFKLGFMDGEGTYTGSANDTYSGYWMMNLKHGKGTKLYANGDLYDGGWKGGMQEGHGRYQWKNGNHYVGQWKNGAMCGNGTMIWDNGNRYDGSWESGLPKGNGTFRWEDGSFYVGVWSKDPREQIGTYHPAVSGAGSFNLDPQEIFSVHLNDCKICPGEKVSILPSQKMLSPGIIGEAWQKKTLNSLKVNDARPMRVSVDGRLSNGSVFSWGSDADVQSDFGNGHAAAGKEVEEGFDSDKSRGMRQQVTRIQLVKKQGYTISKGHKNYELMLNLQLGIRY